MEQADKIDINIIISAPEGELHEFGIMIASLLCCHYNLNFVYLGPNMPAEALAQACNQIKADIIIIGVSRVFDTETGGSLDRFIESFTSDLEHSTKTWLGGPIINSKFLLK